MNRFQRKKSGKDCPTSELDEGNGFHVGMRRGGGAALRGSHRLEFRLVEDHETQTLHFNQALPLE